ncbi:glycosyltransferase family 4 protein [Methylocapsa polymorpha]|uniref:Glycosyltransferase family 4 protein n=1 Tax=Methylocapsa polymorpha TaxID=3080828 RepID=A0ABZ0HTG4_9HYPH|nr:glycosyltransferase family 4 protein [Methylocapsa sp. RX1]
MRILHLIKHCDHGHGNVHFAVDLACAQARRGHEVLFASGGGYYAPLLDSEGVRRAEIRQESRLLSVLRNLAALVRLCWRFKPDVIHAHMMSSAVFGYFASKLTGAPLVTTMHNSFDGHSGLMRLGRIVVAVSSAERDFLLTRGFSPDQVVVILNGPNGSPRENFRPTIEPALATPSIATVCGLHQRKGVHDLIAAFAEVLRDFPDWRLNIIGEGPDREKLEALARELGVSQSTHFLGSIFAPKKLLQRSDIFVMASYAEPFGLAIAEARAAGCAIVATDVGGIPELLAYGKAGQLVEPGHPEQIAAALRKLMQDENALRDWRLRSKSGADYFNVDRVAEDYDKVYAKLKRH